MWFLKDEKGATRWRVRRALGETRIQDRVRDSAARRLRRMGATADMEKDTPQWSDQFKDKQGRDTYRDARIHVVTNCSHERCRSGKAWWILCLLGREGENENVREQERDRLGHGEAGLQRTGWKTRAADDYCSPGVDKKLAETRGGELTAATALRKLKTQHRGNTSEGPSR